VNIETRSNGAATAQYYPERDYTNSVRMVSDGAGSVETSLGYDGDWGLTRIDGQSYVSSDADMASFYRFQSQEAEIFPLAVLSINDTALEAWLDQLQLYHFPYRAYSAGLAVFLSHDPASKSISPYSAFNSNPANFIDLTGAVSNWNRPYTRDFIFCVVWGVVSGTALFLGAGVVTVSTLTLIMTGGRYASHLSNNILSFRRIALGPNGEEHSVSVEGPVALRRVDRSSAEDILFTGAVEILEGFIGSGLARLGWVNSRNATLISLVGVFSVHEGTMGFARSHYYRWTYADYLIDDRGLEIGWRRRMWQSFGRNFSDVLGYGVAYAISAAVYGDAETSDEYLAFLFGSHFALRNISFRIGLYFTGHIFDFFVPGNHFFGVLPGMLPLVTYEEGEEHRIYVRRTGNITETFVWNPQTRVERIIYDLDELVGMARSSESVTLIDEATANASRLGAQQGWRGGNPQSWNDVRTINQRWHMFMFQRNDSIEHGSNDHGNDGQGLP
jgi:hypothetical protein